MAVEHKFLNHDWKNGFWTENAILKTDKYNPEVLFLGTFNPKTPNANFADFFYGRNYFWPVFKNLSNDNVNLLNTRMPLNGAPKIELNPNINEIFEFCLQFKIVFADLIQKVFVNCGELNFEPNDNLIIDNIEYNLINDGIRNGIHGLEQIDLLQEIEWSTKKIIDYINSLPELKFVYLTRRPTAIWGREFNIIKNSVNNQYIEFINIYTPSAQALLGQPRMNALINHWLFNNNPNFGTLNHNWIQNSGAQINNFNNLL